MMNRGCREILPTELIHAKAIIIGIGVDVARIKVFKSLVRTISVDLAILDFLLLLLQIRGHDCHSLLIAGLPEW